MKLFNPSEPGAAAILICADGSCVNEAENSLDRVAVKAAEDCVCHEFLKASSSLREMSDAEGMMGEKALISGREREVIRLPSWMSDLANGEAVKMMPRLAIVEIRRGSYCKLSCATKPLGKTSMFRQVQLGCCDCAR